MKKYFSLLILCFCQVSYGGTLGQILNPLEQYLECNTGNAIEDTICLKAKQIIDQELSQANLQIKNGGLLYSLEQNRNIKLNDRCTREVTLKKTAVKVHVSRDSSIDLSGDAINEPAIFAINIPVAIHGRANLKDRLGKKKRYYAGFGKVKTKCVRIGTDTYHAKGKVSALAQALIMLSLEPKFITHPNGDHILQIKPVIDVSSSVDASFKRFSVHGASPLSHVVTSVTSLHNAAIDTADIHMNGASVEELLEEPLIDSTIELTYGMALTEYAFGASLGFSRIIDHYIESLIDDNVKSANRQLTQVEADLKRQIQNALGLDSNGESFYVFGPDFRPKAVTAQHKSYIRAKRPYFIERQNCQEFGHDRCGVPIRECESVWEAP